MARTITFITVDILLNIVVCLIPVISTRPSEIHRRPDKSEKEKICSQPALDIFPNTEAGKKGRMMRTYALQARAHAAAEIMQSIITTDPITKAGKRPRNANVYE
jgi:hypothetical protein